MYQLSTKELAKKIMQDVRDTIGTICTCGIGTNLYLAKIALDLTAKHAEDFIGELDEETYREKLWDHKPITDFWRIIQNDLISAFACNKNSIVGKIKICNINSNALTDANTRSKKKHQNSIVPFTCVLMELLL